MRSRKLLSVLLLLLMPMRVLAVTATPVFVQTPKLGEAQVLNATSTVAIASNAASATGTVTAYTCGANGSKIVGILAGSTDTSAMTLEVMVINSSKVYVLTIAAVPAGAGTAASTPPVNVFSSANTPGLPIDSDGNPFLYCASGDTIAVGVITTAVTANKAVTALVFAADF